MILPELTESRGLIDDSSVNLAIGDWFDEDQLSSPRTSCDSNDKVNSFDNHLFGLCQSLGIHIFNSRTVSDREGNFTCLTTHGPSVVNYVIVSSDIFCFIDDFEVLPEQPISSVHL